MEPRKYYHPRWTLSGVTLTLSTPHVFNFHCIQFFFFTCLSTDYFSILRLLTTAPWPWGRLRP